MEIKINLSGFEEVIKELKDIAGTTKEAIIKAVTKTAFDVERDAKYFVPVDTGRLRASITTNWPNSGFDRAPLAQPVAKSRPDDTVGQPPEDEEEFNAVVGSNVEYAPYIEFGTSRGVQSTPYLYTALAKNQAILNKRLEDAIKVGK